MENPLDKIFKEGAWKDWSLDCKISYVKGSGGGFNLKRQDIAAISDFDEGPRYKMKTIRMAVDIIDLLQAELLRYKTDPLQTIITKLNGL